MEEYFHDVCLRTARLSTCASRKVGAVLVRDNRILAIGFNGSPSGRPHCENKFGIVDNKSIRMKHHEWSKKNEIHAEANLIAFCAKNGIRTEGTELYISLSPCIDCAKLIVASGIKKVSYIEKYDLDTTGLLFLAENDIDCEYISQK